LPTST